MDNSYEANKFATYFNKKFGAFTYSGEMSLEVALNSINVKDKKVIIQNNVCHRVLMSLIRSGAIPVIVSPSNSFFLTQYDVKKVLSIYDDVKAIIIVHQYGIKSNLKKIKEVSNNIKIIEDIAQSWKIENIGKYSDYVITSFGKTKQLSFGIGGGIFSNDENIINNLDIDFRNSRNSDNIKLPYYLPKNINLKYVKLKKIADKNIRKQKKYASKIKKIIERKHENFNCFNIDDGVWNRYPIWTEDYNYYIKMKEFLKKINIKYELPYRKQLEELSFLKKYKYYFENLTEQKKFIICIKVRDQNLGGLVKWKMQRKKL